MVLSNEPAASVWTTLMTQVVSDVTGGGLGIGSGGPKKQFASSAHEPERLQPTQEFAQSVSDVQAPLPVPTLPLMQCVPGPAPVLQSLNEVPVLGPSVVGPVMSRNVVAPSGIGPGGTVVAAPPPK